MNTAFGDILPLAVAIAISPIPIIATILMLMTPRAKALGFGFLAGWVLGIAVAVTAFTLLAGVIEEPAAGGSQPVLGVIQLLLGAALLVLAARQWQTRPRTPEDVHLPAWMAKIDTMKPGAAFGLAFLLSAINPKNLLLAVSAGTTIGRAGLSGGQVTVLIVVFVVIGALTVAIPVIGYMLAPEKSATVLDTVRDWLAANNSTIMAVLLLVIGAQLLGKGIGSF